MQKCLKSLFGKMSIPFSVAVAPMKGSADINDLQLKIFATKDYIFN